MNQSARQAVIGAAWSGIAGWTVVRISRMLRAAGCFSLALHRAVSS